MTIQECYQQLGGDLSAVENRLRSVGLVERFLAKFLDDGCYATLCSAMEQGDRKQAFLSAHSLKGVAGNLSLDRLAQAVSLLTEILRPEASAIPHEAYLAFQNVQEEYASTTSTIRTFLSAEKG